MTAEVDTGPARRARTLPLRQLPALMREPLKTFDGLGNEPSGEIVRVNLGVSRPYLVTRPEHVQWILRDNVENYPRGGMMWKPLTRLVGDMAGEGPKWALNRGVFQRLMTGPNIASVTGEMARTIAEAVDDLARRATGRPVDSHAEMTRIVQRAIIRVFFGNRISLDGADHLADAIRTAMKAMRPRLLTPFAPLSVRLPGDRAFHEARRAVDEVIFPMVEGARRGETAERDIVSMLIETRDEQGRGLNDQQVRDGVLAMFMAGTETTATALTWLWVALKEHPAIADKVYAEIDAVLGPDMPDRTHLPHLRYTKMVVQELLRVYTVACILPRTSVDDDVIDGIRIKGGSTIVISPYLTHRLADVWPDPDVFDPERFSPARSKGRHRFAYMVFGAGPHQCLGTLLFTVEAQLIAATMLRRFRPVVRNESPVRPQVGLTLSPRERVEIVLDPADRR
ncbi:cytochrome P450 [Actinomadura sp. 1N219]|uniref:cytochrome P450 n=1 Tax=Actinomadura sp. 1N219 TaxID=3375152 RepID=UPI003787CD71